MIIVLRPNASEHDLEQIVAHVTALGLTPHVSRGVSRTIIGCIGDEDRLREAPVHAFPAVETILPVEKPYKLAAREFVARDTEVTLGAAAVGDGAVHVIAGPCSVEGRDMLLETAEAVKAAGAVALRGGAFKPRTSPYAFRGLGAEALDLLAAVRETTGLPVVTEVLDTPHVALVADKADGLLIEVHPDPDHARSDGDQSLTLGAFSELMERVRDVAAAVGRQVAEPVTRSD